MPLLDKDGASTIGIM
jgi:hypothetical protein